MPKRLIFVTGVFDLFHWGHVEFLKKAKSYGDFLLVGVHTDLAVKTFKGKWSIMNELERLRVVKACGIVEAAIRIPCQTELKEEFYDEVFLQVQAISGISDDYSLPKRLGKFKEIPYQKGISTTEILKRIKLRLEEYND